MKKIIVCIIILCLVLTTFFSFVACTEKPDKHLPDDPSTEDGTSDTPETPDEGNAPQTPSADEWTITDSTVADEDKIRVVIYLTVGTENKHINLELYPTIAPLTVANFLRYVDEDYYNNIVFHRVIEGFMIQTGAYYVQDRTIYTKPGQHEAIKGEFAENGVENNISHLPGVISMARTNVMDSATSQFFICSDDARVSLDGKYAGFGRVCDQQSLDVVVEISKLPTAYIDYSLQDFPAQTLVTILSVERYVSGK